MREDNRGVDWPTCSEEECIGIRLDAGGKCLAHAGGQHRDAELKRLGDEGTIDARGVPIGAELLDLILEAAPVLPRLGAAVDPRSRQTLAVAGRPSFVGARRCGSVSQDAQKHVRPSPACIESRSRIR